MNEFSLRTTSFDNKEFIPHKFVYNGANCHGENISPELEWTGAPNEAKSFAVTVFDPDAPGEGWWHWMVVNIPPEVTKLPEGASNFRKIPKGAIEAETDFGTYGYGGPCPPKGKPHRYIFTVYALKEENIEPNIDRITANSLGKASFTVKYGR